MTTSFKVSDDLWLVRQPIARDVAKFVEVKTSHILVVDCSGSMSSDLPKFREQLKRKLPKLLRKDDIISIIWFSGRNEYGVLLEAEPVATLKDLKDIEQAIDRWLRPVCLTGFLQPLQEVTRLVDRISKKYPGYASSLFFISDGHDNCSSRTDVLKVVESLTPILSSVTIVEYGYYADRPLLTQMAQTSGGALIFAEDFDRYAPTFESSISKTISGAPKIEVKLPSEAVSGFVFSMVGNDLLTFSTESGAVNVPEDLPEVWYASSTPVGKQDLEINSIAQNVLGIKAA